MRPRGSARGLRSQVTLAFAIGALTLSSALALGTYFTARHLLVDHARRRDAAKRGDGKTALTLDDRRLESDDDTVAVLALDDALKDIAAIDARLAQIIECRYFAGLSVADTAEALGMAVRTVERDWQRAKAYLLRALELDPH